MEHNMILPQAGVIPVVVLDDAKDAVPTAKALLTGGVDVMDYVPHRCRGGLHQGGQRKLPGDVRRRGRGQTPDRLKSWNAVRNYRFAGL